MAKTKAKTVSVHTILERALTSADIKWNAHDSISQATLVVRELKKRGYCIRPITPKKRKVKK